MELNSIQFDPTLEVNKISNRNKFVDWRFESAKQPLQM